MLLSDEEQFAQQTAKTVGARFGRTYWLRCMKEERPPHELWSEMAKSGLAGAGVPEEYGGSGLGLMDVALIQEALALEGLPLLHLLTTHLSRFPMIKHGTRSQIERFVRPTCAGKKISLCVTEAEAGSDIWSIRTFAERKGNGYVLSGQKVFITGAAESDYLLIVARTRRYEEVQDKRHGLSLFMLDSHSPGIRYERLRIDMHAPEWQYIVYFDGAELDQENLLGEEGQGHRYIFEGLNVERVLISACSLGLGEHVLRKAAEYANQRKVFGRPIGSNQGIQFPLAKAKMHLEAARLVTYDAAKKIDSNRPVGAEANMAKYLASEAALEALDASMQAFGGNAFAEETDVIGFYPIIRLFKTAPVTNELVLGHVATHLLGLPRSY